MADPGREGEREGLRGIEENLGRVKEVNTHIPTNYGKAQQQTLDVLQSSTYKGGLDVDTLDDPECNVGDHIYYFMLDWPGMDATRRCE